MINGSFGNIEILAQNVIIKTNKDVYSKKNLFIFIPNGFEIISENSYVCWHPGSVN